MKDIGDVLILGGVAAAGYFIMRSAPAGGGTAGRIEPIQYISKVPLGLSPTKKPIGTETEPQSTPIVINLPSESVTFPAPQLPTISSLLPAPQPTQAPQPTVSPVTKTPQVTKKEKKETKSILEEVPAKWKPETTFWEQIPKPAGVTKSSSKKKSLPKDWSKGSPYWEQALKEPERFSERSVWEVAKEIDKKKKETAKKETKKQEKIVARGTRPVTAKRVATRSRAAFTRSFGWR